MSRCCIFPTKHGAFPTLPKEQTTSHSLKVVFAFLGTMATLGNDHWSFKLTNIYIVLLSYFKHRIIFASSHLFAWSILSAISSTERFPATGTISEATCFFYVSQRSYNPVFLRRERRAEESTHLGGEMSISRSISIGHLCTFPCSSH